MNIRGNSSTRGGPAGGGILVINSSTRGGGAGGGVLVVNSSTRGGVAVGVVLVINSSTKGGEAGEESLGYVGQMLICSYQVSNKSTEIRCQID